MNGHEKKMVRIISDLRSEGKCREFSPRQCWDSDECSMKPRLGRSTAGLNPGPQAQGLSLYWRKSEIKSGADTEDPDNDPSIVLQYLKFTVIGWQVTDMYMILL